jgi:hypothetical protein
VPRRHLNVSFLTCAFAAVASRPPYRGVVLGLLTRGRVTVAAAVVAAAAGAGATAVVAGAPSSPHVVSMPAAGRTEAALEVTSGTPVLDISVARLGGTLLRVSTPDGAPVRPVLSGSAPVLLSLAGDRPAPGHGGPGYAVLVVLNSAVTWSIDLAGGTERTDVDLRGGKVRAIAAMAGSDILDVSLPAPAGTVRILLAGGASQFLLSLPGGVPAQVTAGGGAGFLTVDGQRLTGVAGGTVVATPGWATARSRVEVDMTAGVYLLAVSRW